MSWERKVQKKPSWSSSTQASRESLFKTQGFSKPVEEPVEKTALKPIQFRGRDTSHLDHIKVNSDRPIVTPRVNLSNLQTKLTVGAPGDKYEQEADSMAQKVMSTPDSAVQRMTPGEEEEVRTKPLAANITPLVQREEMPEEKEELQAKPLGNGTIQREEMPEEKEIQTKRPLQRRDGSFQAGGNIESKLNSSKGWGSPLGDNVRAFMEPRFGNDFSSVRVHTGDEAVYMNRELGAQAFTHGSDVYFGAGKAPGNNELTAHELMHVVQQTETIQAMDQNYTPADANYSRNDGTETNIYSPSDDSKDSGETLETEKQLAQLNEELAFEIAKGVADLAGIVDPTPVSDGISASISLAQGDYVSAGLSIVAMLPYIGDAIGKPLKMARNAAIINKIKEKIRALVKIIDSARKKKPSQEIINSGVNAVKKGIGNASKAIPKISPQKQAGHIKGTPQYNNRIKQGKATSAFDDAESAEKLVQEAWDKGQPVAGKPNVRDYDFGIPIGTGPRGGKQQKVRVHLDQKGEIHGHPSGPEIP